MVEYLRDRGLKIKEFEFFSGFRSGEKTFGDMALVGYDLYLVSRDMEGDLIWVTVRGIITEMTADMNEEISLQIESRDDHARPESGRITIDELLQAQRISSMFISELIEAEGERIYQDAIDELDGEIAAAKIRLERELAQAVELVAEREKYDSPFL